MQANPADGHMRTSGMADGCTRSSVAQARARATACQRATGLPRRRGPARSRTAAAPCPPAHQAASAVGGSGAALYLGSGKRRGPLSNHACSGLRLGAKVRRTWQLSAPLDVCTQQLSGARAAPAVRDNSADCAAQRAMHDALDPPGAAQAIRTTRPSSLAACSTCCAARAAARPSSCAPASTRASRPRGAAAARPLRRTWRARS
jgi:hypothetical protein